MVRINMVATRPDIYAARKLRPDFPNSPHFLQWIAAGVDIMIIDTEIERCPKCQADIEHSEFHYFPRVPLDLTRC